MLWVLFVLLIAFTFCLFRFARFWVFYEVEQGGGRQ
jgi:hypothetical protein